MVVGIFWVVVGDGGYFFGSGGWWWMVMGVGTVYNSPFTTFELQGK